jgi:hypothetical protein
MTKKQQLLRGLFWGAGIGLAVVIGIVASLPFVLNNVSNGPIVMGVLMTIFVVAWPFLVGIASCFAPGYCLLNMIIGGIVLISMYAAIGFSIQYIRWEWKESPESKSRLIKRLKWLFLIGLVLVAVWLFIVLS